MPMFAGHDIRPQPFSQDRQLAFHCASIHELEQAKAFIICDGEHRTKWRFDALREKSTLCFRRRRRFTKNSSESIAKPALRFEAAAVSHLVHALALLYSAQCETHSPGAMIGLECHSIMTLKLSSCRRRIDRHRDKFLIGDTAVRGAIHLLAQTREQFRRRLMRIHRMATQTQAITAVQRFTWRREKSDVAAFRLFCGASWATKNSRCSHPGVKNSLETRIAINQGAIHGVWRREKFRYFHWR